MKISYEHHSTCQAVRSKLEGAIKNALDLGAGRVQDIDYTWNADRLSFSFAAMGKTIRGHADVTDTEVVLDIGLPFMFRPFEGRAKSRILEALDEMLR